MNEENDAPFSGPDPDGEIDEQEQYDEGLDDDELDEDEMDDDDDVKIPDGFHLE